MWVSDHLLQADPTSTPDSEMLEAYTTLGFLAAQTERVRLGTMVTAVTYRPPAVLIKAVTTLDVLSRGRAWLGLGAGYQQDEARAMDLLPALPERFERLEETLRLALQMWAGDASAFEGKHYHLARPVGNPAPVRRPHPPILTGGTGERRTLPLVARYANACNLFDVPDGGATVRHKLAVLAHHCEQIGRPYGEIERTISTRLSAGEAIHALWKLPPSIRYIVDDLDAAIAFYCEHLGFHEDMHPAPFRKGGDRPRESIVGPNVSGEGGGVTRSRMCLANPRRTDDGVPSR